tara:strand:- start:2883 stop:3059 length:177 start_codon:yes stop_codon:yes gene_type:complete
VLLLISLQGNVNFCIQIAEGVFIVSLLRKLNGNLEYSKLRMKVHITKSSDIRFRVGFG